MQMNSQALKELKGLVAERKLHLDASYEHNYGNYRDVYCLDWIAKRDELEDQISFLNSQIAQVVSENV